MTLSKIALGCKVSMPTAEKALKSCDWFERMEGWKWHLTTLGHQVATSKVLLKNE